MMPMHAIVLLPRYNRDRQPVFFGRQRARRVGSYRAGRIVSAVEIENYFVIDDWVAVQKSATRISIRFAAQISHHKAEALCRIATQCRKREVLPIEFEMHFSSNRRWRNISEHIRNIDRLLSIRWNKRPGNPIIHVERKENRTGIIACPFTIQVLHSHSESLATLDEMHSQAAHLNHGR